MTKYKFSTDKNNNFFKYKYDMVSNVIFGLNAYPLKREFKEYWEGKVGSVTTYPKGTESDNSLIYLNGRYDIELNSFLGADARDYDAINKSYIHEVLDSFSSVLPKFKKNKGFKTMDGTIKKPFMGKIYESTIDGEKTIYGDMFNATAINMLTDMIDDTSVGENINRFLSTNYEDTDDKGYVLLASITRLAIAAFSNNPYINYSTVYSNSIGLFDVKTVMENGNLLRANDFLYGTLYDPTHIEKSYDKRMGKGSYKQMCLDIDRAYEYYLEGKVIPRHIILNTMNRLTDYSNTKFLLGYDEGLLNRHATKALMSNYKKAYDEVIKAFKEYNNEVRHLDIPSNNSFEQPASTVSSKPRKLLNTRRES